MVITRISKGHVVFRTNFPYIVAYSSVERIRETKKDNDIESAIDRSITEIPDDFEIKPFLVAHRSEVKGMLLTEYNEVETMQLFKEDGKKEGIKLGIKEGTLSTLISLVQDGVIDVETAAGKAGMSEKDFISMMNKLQ